MASNDPFPNWSVPATKGDVIRTIIYINACLSNLAAAIVAERQGDKVGMAEKMNEYFAAQRKLSEILADIGGSDNNG